MDAVNNSEEQQVLDEIASSKTRLNKIKQQVDQVQLKLTDRLILQRRNVASKVCATIWLLKTVKGQNSLEEKQKRWKQIRLDLSRHQYNIGEQSELLLRLLCELDDLLSYGNLELKQDRKKCVLHIQNLLDEADAMKQKADHLIEFANTSLSSLLEHHADNSIAQDATESMESADEVPSNDQMDQAEETDKPNESIKENEEPREEEVNDVADEVNKDEDDLDNQEEMDDQCESEDSDGEDEDSDEEDEHMEEGSDSTQQETSQEIDREVINMLPWWQPKAIQQDFSDEKVIKVNLRGVDPNHVAVKIHRSGILQISGFKLPTARDLRITKFTGVPSYGRFIIEERILLSTYCLDQICYSFEENGFLRVSIPVRQRQSQRQHVFINHHPMHSLFSC